MKKIMYKNIIAVFAAIVALSSCYKDEGNYDYNDKAVAEITIEGLPTSLTLAQKLDSIVLTPTIKSSLDGVIDEKNSNYEFGCTFITEAGYFLDGTRSMDINPDHKKDVSFMPKENTGTYLCWYTVKDKRSGVVKNASVKVNIVSAVSNGWMVLCDAGEENVVRLDMVSIMDERVGVITDLLGPNAPVRHNAKNIYGYAFAQYNTITISSEEGASFLNTDLTTSKTMDAESQFIAPLENEKVINAPTWGYYCNYMFTDKGYVYAKGLTAGACFDQPCNTSRAGTTPDYQVAPMMAGLPNTMVATYYTLLYDITNNRFMALYYYYQPSTTLLPIADENQPAAEDNIAKVIGMYGTEFAGARAYSVLENTDGDRIIYGHNLNVSSVMGITLDFKKKITADGFNKAKYYAFHSQYPYVMFDKGNEVVAYNIMTEAEGTGITVPANEEITMIKSNLFMQDYSQTGTKFDNPKLNNLAYTVLVGSCDKNDKVNGGILRIYKLTDQGKMELIEEYKGFAQIRDVMYRETWVNTYE